MQRQVSSRKLCPSVKGMQLQEEGGREEGDAIVEIEEKAKVVNLSPVEGVLSTVEGVLSTAEGVSKECQANLDGAGCTACSMQYAQQAASSMHTAVCSMQYAVCTICTV